MRERVVIYLIIPVLIILSALVFTDRVMQRNARASPPDIEDGDFAEPGGLICMGDTCFHENHACGF